jgi:hypothetical protein
MSGSWLSQLRSDAQLIVHFNGHEMASNLYHTDKQYSTHYISTIPKIQRIQPNPHHHSHFHPRPAMCGNILCLARSDFDGKNRSLLCSGYSRQAGIVCFIALQSKRATPCCISDNVLGMQLYTHTHTHNLLYSSMCSTKAVTCMAKAG